MLADPYAGRENAHLAVNGWKDIVLEFPYGHLLFERLRPRL